MKRLIFIGFACFLIAVGIAYKAGSDERRMESHTFSQMLRERKAIEEIQEATRWVLTEGIVELVANPLNSKDFRNLLKSFWPRVSTVTGAPITEKGSDITRVLLMSGGIGHDIRRILSSGELEYWIVKVWGKEWTFLRSDVCFVVVRNDRKSGLRHIVHADEHFFSRFSNEGGELVLPLDDLNLLSHIAPWDFPDRFPNHRELTKYYIDLDSSGKMVKKRLWVNPHASWAYKNLDEYYKPLCSALVQPAE